MRSCLKISTNSTFPKEQALAWQFRNQLTGGETGFSRTSRLRFGYLLNEQYGDVFPTTNKKLFGEQNVCQVHSWEGNFKETDICRRFREREISRTIICHASYPRITRRLNQARLNY